MRIFAAVENLLSYLPRTVLLALAVLAMRNPFAEGRLDRFGWYVKWPLQFVLLLLLALAVCAALRLVLTHRGGAEGGRARPLA